MYYPWCLLISLSLDEILCQITLFISIFFIKSHEMSCATIIWEDFFSLAEFFGKSGGQKGMIFASFSNVCFTVWHIDHERKVGTLHFGGFKLAICGESSLFPYQLLHFQQSCLILNLGGSYPQCPDISKVAVQGARLLPVQMEQQYENGDEGCGCFISTYWLF